LSPCPGQTGPSKPFPPFSSCFNSRVCQSDLMTFFSPYINPSNHPPPVVTTPGPRFPQEIHLIFFTAPDFRILHTSPDHPPPKTRARPSPMIPRPEPFSFLFDRSPPLPSLFQSFFFLFFFVESLTSSWCVFCCLAFLCFVSFPLTPGSGFSFFFLLPVCVCQLNPPIPRVFFSFLPGAFHNLLM